MGKQYAILRVQKCKGAAIGAMQYHNDREPGKHANPDIDQTRTRLNREMRPHVDYEREVQARIDDGYSGERKVRKDAVKLVEGIRGAVGRLEVAIADLTRRLWPRSARMTTKALKRDLAALERDYGEDDDRSPKARAAEAQRAARARDANRDDRPPQRSWSQSR